MRIPLTAVVGLCVVIAAGIAMEPDAPNQKQAGSPGNPPQVVLAEGVDQEGALQLVSYRTIYIGFSGESYNSRSTKRVPLSDVRIQTVEGVDLSIDEVRDRLNKETPVLVSSFHEELPEIYQSLFDKDAIVFRFPRKAPVWEAIQEPDRPLKK